MGSIIGLSGEEVYRLVKGGRVRVCVVGLGRIGLPTATVLADAGLQVHAVDINPNIVARVNRGEPHIDEPELNGMLARAVAAGRLRATTNLGEAASGSDVTILCLPTPVDPFKRPDYSAVVSACRELSGSLQPGSLVVVESTVGPGTVEGLVVPLLEEGGRLKAGEDFGVASCPERANPSEIVRCMRTIPRVVGGITRRSGEVASAFYRAALGVEVVLVSDPKTANAVKLTENIFRNVNIALMNEMASLFERLGIDVIEVIRAAATKWNFVPHYPGPGVGGPCLPHNPYYLLQEAYKVGYVPHLIQLSLEINERMPEHTVSLVMEALNEAGRTVKGSLLCVLGLSYKPNLKDAKDSPSKQIIARLRQLGAELKCYDPYFAGEELFGLTVARSLDEAVKGVHGVVLCVAHDAFRELPLEDVAKKAHTPCCLIDATGTLQPHAARRLNFVFRGIGRT